MKSNLFLKDYIPGEDFRADYEILSSLTVDQLSFLADYILNLDFEKEPSIEYMRDISTKLQIDIKNVRALLDISMFLMLNIYKNKDDVSDVMHDLISQCFMDETQLQKMIDYFKTIEPVANRYFVALQQDISEVSVSPTLLSIQYVNGLHSVNENKFDSDIRIEDYSPNITSFVPVSTIRLTILEEMQKEVVFQLDSRGLEKMIVTLQACQKELRLLEKVSKEAKIESILSSFEG